MSAKFALALAALIALATSPSAAEPYPDHPVTLIVPYAAGGSSDVLARLLNEPLSKALGQPIIIDNRAGAGSRTSLRFALFFMQAVCMIAMGVIIAVPRVHDARYMGMVG